MHHPLSSLPSALLFALAASAGSAAAATVCNGYSEYCSMLYSNVTVVGAHNSYTSSNTNLAASQDYGVTQQLTDGVRLLQNQVHNQNGVLELCHTSCLLYDGGSLSSYLTKVKAFLDANPNEVVTLLLVNSDDQPASSFASAYQAAGIDTYAWSPTAATVATNAWPTVGSLIDSGKRLVSFMDNSADFTIVPYILDEFSNMWETHYDITDASGFNCTVDRHSGDTTDQMYLINHYLYTQSTLFGGNTPVPNKAALPVTNAVSGVGSLGEEAGTTCLTLHPRAPTFLLVDFYDWGSGSVFQVAASLNGVQYVAKSIAAQNGTDASSSSSGSGSTSTSTKNGADQAVMVGRSSVWTAVVVGACAVFGSFVAI
ncbi:hypothetical protein FRB95_006617 [Tulasnella sp. JGI-2019a]|nr:hypothetical protein FRB95_006617 [Tulasnella sp. JGI-2019a]